MLILSNLPAIRASHYMKRIQPSIPAETGQNETPLIITNNCDDDIWLGINTQDGSGPSEAGFMLSPGSRNNLSVSADWQGRVWDRTNYSFNSDGTGLANNGTGMACDTGDCNGVLNCQVTMRSKTKTTFALLIAVLSLICVAG